MENKQQRQPYIRRQKHHEKMNKRKQKTGAVHAARSDVSQLSAVTKRETNPKKRTVQHTGCSQHSQPGQIEKATSGISILESLRT